MRRNRAGYTLFEVVLVVTLVAILAALGYPTLDTAYNGMKVQSAADAVRSAWAEAKAHAINDGRAYRFAYYPGKGNYRVAPDSADFWAGAAGDTASSDQGQDPPLVLEDALPRRLIFGGPGDGDLGESFVDPGSIAPASWTIGAVFLPDGTVRDDTQLTVSLIQGPSLTLRMRSLTGVVTVVRGG